jgi:hypothetical protein
MKTIKFILIPIFLLLLAHLSYSQKKETPKKEDPKKEAAKKETADKKAAQKEAAEKDARIKTFISLDGRKAFLKDNYPSMFGFKVGAKINCKFIFGFAYHKLNTPYITTATYHNPDQYSPEASNTKANNVKMNIKTYTMFIAPILINEKKIDFYVPVHIGVAEMRGQYLPANGDYCNLPLKTPWLIDVSGLFGFKLVGFMGLTVGAGYIIYFSNDKAIQKMSTPTLAFGLKFGSGCKK